MPQAKLTQVETAIHTVRYVKLSELVDDEVARQLMDLLDDDVPVYQLDAGLLFRPADLVTTIKAIMETRMHDQYLHDDFMESLAEALTAVPPGVSVSVLE